MNFSFRLRHLFGPGGRSETIRVLLTCPDGRLDTARIADEAGFAKRNISDVLTSLTASGVIKATWAGNERRFTAYIHQRPTLGADYLPILAETSDAILSRLGIAH